MCVRRATLHPLSPPHYRAPALPGPGQTGFGQLPRRKNLLKGFIPATNNEPYFQGATFGNILSYVQTHPRSASLKERKEQRIISFEDVQRIQAAKRILSELVSEETVGV